MTRRIAALLLAGLTVTTAGCGPDDKEAEPAPPTASSAPAALKTGEVVLDFPVDEADVRRCEILRGRANLPAGKTLVLGVRNKDNGNPERYFQVVEDWEYPADLKDWKGAQWFGDADSSAGQGFRVEVLVVDLALTRKLAEAAKTEGFHSPDNPRGATVAAHIDLHRVKGKGPDECS